MTDLKALEEERGAVYGDALQNHQFISMAWAGQLQPHWQAIRDGVPIPPDCTARMFASVKLLRMRLKFKQDNYDDLTVYTGFSEKWQNPKPSPLSSLSREELQCLFGRLLKSQEQQEESSSTEPSGPSPGLATPTAP
jgi:hypothetical protein